MRGLVEDRALLPRSAHRPERSGGRQPTGPHRSEVVGINETREREHLPPFFTTPLARYSSRFRPGGGVSISPMSRGTSRTADEGLVVRGESCRSRRASGVRLRTSMAPAAGGSRLTSRSDELRSKAARRATRAHQRRLTPTTAPPHCPHASPSQPRLASLSDAPRGPATAQRQHDPDRNPVSSVTHQREPNADTSPGHHRSIRMLVLPP